MARGGAAKVVETACGPLSDVGVLPRERMGRYEIELVQQKRRSFRASWQDCANMVGRSVHDVRLACDPTYAEAAGLPRGADKSSLGVLGKLLELELRTLVALASFEASAKARERRSKEVATTELAKSVGAGSNIVGRALNRLERRGLINSRRTGESHRLTCLTAAGAKLVEGGARG